MTGFSNWLRWVFHIPKRDSVWASSSRKHLLVPVRIKVHVRNKRQIEYKVEYLVQPGLKEQIYDLRLFLFFPAELDAASTSFFASLFESVRLHTPTVDPSELTEPDGPALRGIREALTELKSKMAKDADVGPAQKRVVYQLQLLGCTFRRALRKRGKRIIVALSSASEGLPSAEDERVAAAGICDLLETADAAMRTIQKVCSGCLADGSPRWQQEAWRLVEEQMLLEARITLLKLTSRLDDIYAEVRTDKEEDSWPALTKSLPPCGPVEGSCLDRQQVQCLREQIARGVSLAYSADSNEGAGKDTATADNSAGQFTIDGASTNDDSARAVGNSDTEAPSPVKQKPMASAFPGALAHSNTGLTGTGSQEAGQRAGTQEAEWQLTSLSRKALSSGRTKSSSLEWIYPGTLLRRLSMMGRGGEQSLQSRAVREEDSHAAADSGPPCVDEEPDLELGLLPDQNADSVSALHTNGTDQSTVHANSRRRPDADQRSHAARALLSRARVLALQQTERLEALSEQKDYSESLLDEGADLENEHYTDRVKVLKRHSRLAVTLAPKTMPRSMVADDIVGMTVAGLAMSAALVTIWLAQRNTPYGVLYLAIYVAGYILKDRIKEWGKRYLAPMLAWFGIEFPDRVVKFRDYFGRVVGRCREKVSMKDGLECDARILRMRYSSQNWVPEGKEQVIKPERVLVLAKSMRVRWRQLDAHLQGGVTSLDDLMRIDLHYITRGMQPSREKHLAVKRSPDGRLSVQDIDCARVYHVNSVMEIRTQGASPEKSLQLQKTRIILDDEGIKRLEPGGHDHLQRTRRPRLPAAADALRRIRLRSSTEAPLKAD